MRDQEPQEAGSLIRELARTPESKRADRLLAHISTVVSEILEKDEVERFAPQQKIFELGLGSLIVIELKNRLEKACDTELPVTLFFSNSTLEQLGDHLLTRVLKLAPPRRDARAPAGPERVAEVQDTTAVEELTEEEAEARLLERITELDDQVDS